VTKPSEHGKEFTIFVMEIEPRLSVALAAAYGVETGRDSAADALEYAWAHWSDVRDMENPGGYLYWVGQSAARQYVRRGRLFPPVDHRELSSVEPALPDALGELTEAQRAAVVLVHVLEWTEREAAALLGVDRSTVRRHCERGLAKLRAALEIKADA
jgi:RNA polymerase sigma factor (sigma-70 family)